MAAAGWGAAPCAGPVNGSTGREVEARELGRRWVQVSLKPHRSFKDTHTWTIPPSGCVSSHPFAKERGRFPASHASCMVCMGGVRSIKPRFLP